MARATDPRGRAEPDDEFDLERGGEAEAARRVPRRRRWPWVLVALGLPVGFWLLWSAIWPSGLPQPRAAQIAVAPAPQWVGAEQATAPAGAVTSALSGPPPGNQPARSVTREPGTLASTSRTMAARAETREAAEKARARAESARAAATQVAAKTEEARPGVNRAGKPWVNRHPELTIPSHTPISCLPDSPINSSAQGPITCTVDEPVWSEDGNVVLLWPQAVIEGYLGQGLQYGQRRLMLTFERIRTTDFARIPLRGIGASALGENGITGTYDSHLWEKIQAGVLLTVIEGAVDAGVGLATNALRSDDGGGGQFFNFGSVGGRARGTLGQSALQQDYNRPPTLRRDHADTITVKTVGDLDLSEVFQLEEVRAASARATQEYGRRPGRGTNR